jgi:NAD(P)-dependent dehydrogenase (short-subunit alcohol dehydrogenase family)
MKKAIILGGTRGLGAALAHECARRGVQPIVYGSSVGSDEGEPAEPLPPGAVSHRLDLTDAASVAAFNPEEDEVGYFFWVAGVFLKKRLVDTSAFEMDRMVDIHFKAPLQILQRFQRARRRAYHLVCIASCSSWRLREDESIYCALKAAQATFTRNFTPELVRDLPGSKVLLVNPGGLKTPHFWKDVPTELEGFMDPSRVAAIIWNTLSAQQGAFHEMQILRRKPVVPGSDPLVEHGPKLPEVLS